MTGRRPAAIAAAVLLSVVACSAAPAPLDGFIRRWSAQDVAYTVRYLLGVPTGDLDVDAAIDSAAEAEALRDAEELMERARRVRDAELMDEAIRRRPGDALFRVSHAVLALEQGDLRAFREWAATVPRVDQHVARAVVDAEIRELTALHVLLSLRGHASDAQCRELYGRLRDLHRLRSEGHGTPRDAERAAAYDTAQARCPSGSPG